MGDIKVSYRQMKAIRCAERLIRRHYGVGCQLGDLKNYGAKSFRKTNAGEKARVVCEALLSIGEVSEN